MSLSIGIVGLPNVGKSTLFNALLKRQAALVASYPFATIEPNIGVVDVPDERLLKLADIVRKDYKTEPKIVPTTIKFYDIAGLVKGAHEGEGLGNEFLGHIREVDVILHVIRDFHDENVVRAGSIDPEGDLITINTELKLADIQTVNNRIEKTKKVNKKEIDFLNEILSVLNSEEEIYDQTYTEEESKILKSLNLVTNKPMMYVLNIDEQELGKGNTHIDSVALEGHIRVCAKIESEIAQLDEKDRENYLKQLGVSMSGLDKVILKGYELLGLRTFLTIGPDEVRAWSLKSGLKAPQAAGLIHTDFQRGFIAAELVNYKDLELLDSWKLAKEKGKVRLEGKNYVIKDGDVMIVRFNV